VASWGDTWNETIFVALMTLTLYLATQNYLKFIVVKPLLFLGAISYPLYLVHEVIGFIIIKYLYGFHLNPYLILFTATIVTMAIATLISIFIERPSLAFLTNKHKELTSSETKQSRMEPYSNEGN
jgi:peptidoglycan/LPS O-acetylase OafA/YrhL